MSFEQYDEPVAKLVKKRVRIKKTTGTDIICNIQLALWGFLFSKLELVDLIMLQRTNETFAGYKILDSLIKQKNKSCLFSYQQKTLEQNDNNKKSKSCF